MPCTVEMVDVRLAQPLDAVAADQLRQALAVQNIEDHERPAPRAHLFHRWVIELAPFHRELDRVDMGDALPPGERRELAADACAPVHHGAEDVEQAGADVHRTQSYRLDALCRVASASVSAASRQLVCAIGHIMPACSTNCLPLTAMS